MVDVMVELQRRRTASRVFHGKHGFITPRDLFRWADRKPLTYQELAEAGYMLLGERLRQPDEQATVREVLEKMLPRVTVAPTALYNTILSDHRKEVARMQSGSAGGHGSEDDGAVWISSTVRLYALVAKCMENDEPVLLVGETGTGKTTVCQLYAEAVGQKLHIINCHQHTETADFLGGLRPARGRAFQVQTLSERTCALESGLGAMVGEAAITASAAATAAAAAATSASSDDPTQDEVVAALEQRIEAAATVVELAPAAEQAALQEEVVALRELAVQCKALFVWEDGPLLTAMRNGDILLVDEISLADDAVLERLNSVLDPARMIVLPEKGRELEEVVAAPGFRLLATMNPGGDFGKKELSPALRNRFTEVWVPAVTAKDELLQLLRTRLGTIHVADNEWDAAGAMLSFVEWLGLPDDAASSGAPSVRSVTPSLRDLTAWVDFQNATAPDLGPHVAFVHGACLVFIDAIGLSVASSRAARSERRAQCIKKLCELLPLDIASQGAASLFVGCDTVPDMEDSLRPAADSASSRFGLPPFFVELGAAPSDALFSLHAPTTRANVFRVLRALQLRKPILLEGSPGVGKTSLIQALGAACGHNVVRINLSEQSDLMELLGTDLPVEGAPPGTYAWQDGAFLAALKAGHWVILDELNLAPQSVLEGLNSCLDHRASVYIPELAASFDCPKGFRVFACQNPLQQGGGRKGLPKSFLNRFTQASSHIPDPALCMPCALRCSATFASLAPSKKSQDAPMTTNITMLILRDHMRNQI